MSKEVFLAKLKGKTFGGALDDFNSETLQGDNIFYSVKGYVALRLCRVIIPRDIIEYIDDEYVITNDEYYTIEGRNE